MEDFNVGLDSRLEKFRIYLDENEADRKFFVSQGLPFDLGERTDPTPFFRYMVDSKFLPYFFETLDRFGEERTGEYIGALNTAGPERVLASIHVPSRIGLEGIEEPVLVPNPNYVFEDLLPYAYCLSGKTVKKEEFGRRVDEIGLEGKKYRKEIKLLRKIENIVTSEYIRNGTEEIIRKKFNM